MTKLVSHEAVLECIHQETTLAKNLALRALPTITTTERLEALEKCRVVTKFIWGCFCEGNLEIDMCDVQDMLEKHGFIESKPCDPEENEWGNDTAFYLTPDIQEVLKEVSDEERPKDSLAVETKEEKEHDETTNKGDAAAPLSTAIERSARMGSAHK